jgi:transportin-3
LKSLRDSLLEHLEKLSGSSYSSVQTQIYIALSDLIMLMNTWTNPLPEIIQRFTKPPDRMNALIEFLTILPEEVNIQTIFFYLYQDWINRLIKLHKINNKRLRLGQNRRDHLKVLFSNSSAYIIEFLEANLSNCLEILRNDHDQYQHKLQLIYKCFSSWIEEKLIDTNLIVNSKLFVHLFQIFVCTSVSFDFVFIVFQYLIDLFSFFFFNLVWSFNWTWITWCGYYLLGKYAVYV